MDEAGATVQFFEQNARSAYDWNLERSPGLSDTPQSLSFAEVYELPIGKGKLVNVQNEAANFIIGGWKLAGAEQYSQGNPFSPVAGDCTSNHYGGTTSAINPGLNPGCYADYNKSFNGNVKIRKMGTGDKTLPYFDKGAFNYELATPYSLGDTPRTLAFPSMHGEFYKNENVSLTKTFPFPFFFGENASFVFRADMLNVFNRTIFEIGPGAGMNPGTDSFGVVTGQEDSPRFLQFEGHVRF
jgi:hypothetical protein